MLRMRPKKLFALLVGAVAAIVVGCSAPLSAPLFKKPAPPPSASARLATIPDLPGINAPATSSTEPDLAGVLDKLQQVREIDPSAELKLREELRRTPPKSWPLVAEQFRASLAYHKKLAAEPNPADTQSTTTSRFEASTIDPATALQTGYDTADTDHARQPGTQLASNSQPKQQSRPSERIGALVDPRAADADGVSSEDMAKATPYSSPGAAPQLSRDTLSVPGQFVAQDAPAPIPKVGTATDDAPQRASLDPAVVPTRLETPAIESERKLGSTSAADDADWQQLVERAADDLNSRVAEAPATTAEVHQHVSLRMLWLLAGDTEKALEPIPRIAPAEQDYWSRQLFALATYLDHHTQPDDKRRAAASVTHLEHATASLHELGALSLRSLTFCKNVYGYGSFDPFPNEQFSPGQQVALYVEVENYHSESSERGYCTSLASSYELLDEKGQRVAGGEFPVVDDCCRSRRRDFHIQYGLALPDKISPGRYQLQLVIKDRQSDKMGHTAASFEIRGNRIDLPPLSTPAKQ